MENFRYFHLRILLQVHLHWPMVNAFLGATDDSPNRYFAMFYFFAVKVTAYVSRWLEPCNIFLPVTWFDSRVRIVGHDLCRNQMANEFWSVNSFAQRKQVLMFDLTCKKWKLQLVDKNKGKIFGYSIKQTQQVTLLRATNSIGAKSTTIE